MRNNCSVISVYRDFYGTSECIVKESTVEVPQLAALILQSIEFVPNVASFQTPCGGHGTCHKCRVRINGNISEPSLVECETFTQSELTQGWRLACCTTVLGNAVITLPEKELSISHIALEGIMPSRDELPFSPVYTGYAAAIDIGTTTIACALCSCESRLPVAYAAVKNPQSSFGSDVLSRVSASLSGKGNALSETVLRALDVLLAEVCGTQNIRVQSIQKIVICANTSMLYLLTGRNPHCLSEAPFKIDEHFACTVPAGTLSISGGALCSVLPETPVYMPLCISAFNGADCTAAMFSCHLREEAEKAAAPVLLADIGTNAEMVLYIPSSFRSSSAVHLQNENGVFVCCSAAAGPAFEGVGISCGMCSTQGAIHSVVLLNGKCVCSVIGGGSAHGICGSGLLDAVAVCAQSGLIDADGSINDEDDAFLEVISVRDGSSEREENAIVISTSSDGKDVILTQHDIRNFQLAKSAVCAGLLSLLEYTGISADDVHELYVAGGFGSSLNSQNAAVTGLVPQKLAGKICSAGNAALSGAVCMLQNAQAISLTEQYELTAQVLSLAESERFQTLFIQCMTINRL